MLKLRFLTTDTRWIDLALRYWQYEPAEKKFPVLVEQLAEEMSTNIRQVCILLADHCQAYDDQYLCSKCGKPARIFLSRSDFQAFYRISKWSHGVSQSQKESLCDACGKLQEEEERSAAQRQKQIEDSIKLEILRGYQDKPPQVSISDLTLEQTLFLDAYGRAGLTENFTLLLSISTLRSRRRKLAPTLGTEIEIVNALFDAGLIEIHPKNPPDVLDDIKSSDDFTVYTESAHWYFPVNKQNPTNPASLFQEIEQAFWENTWPEPWRKQVLPLWRKIAVWECLEYMDYVMDQHSLPFQSGEKTIETLQSLLTHFSAGQISNFIWRAGQSAAAYYMRSGGSKRQAANRIVGNIQNLAERAVAEHWQVKTFQRNFKCEQSIISQVLFDAALKKGEAGFTSVPHDMDK